MSGGALEVVAVPWVELDDEQALRAWNVQAWTHVWRVSWLVGHWTGATRLEGEGQRANRFSKSLGNKTAHTALAHVHRWYRQDKYAPLLYNERDPQGLGEWTAEERAAAAVMDWYTWLPAQLGASLTDLELIEEWAAQIKLDDKRAKGLVKNVDHGVQNIARLTRLAGEGAGAAGRAADAQRCAEAFERKVVAYVDRAKRDAGD